eukprot:14154-Heterococcus_DN1.PRE.3
MQFILQSRCSIEYVMHMQMYTVKKQYSILLTSIVASIQRVSSVTQKERAGNTTCLHKQTTCTAYSVKVVWLSEVAVTQHVDCTSADNAEMTAHGVRASSYNPQLRSLVNNPCNIKSYFVEAEPMLLLSQTTSMLCEEACVQST